MEENAELHFSKDDLDLFSGNIEKIKNINHLFGREGEKVFPGDKFKMKRKLPPKHFGGESQLDCI